MTRVFFPVVILLAMGVSACGHRSQPETAPQPAGKAADNTVTSKTIQDAGNQPIEKLLADRVSGVRLGTAADGSLTVTIRGATSWNGDNAPLYVIDGVPITPGPGGALDGINPYDIEKIEVLKDPAQTAMYGSRGANGVIIIKMKKP